MILCKPGSRGKMGFRLFPKLFRLARRKAFAPHYAGAPRSLRLPTAERKLRTQRARSRDWGRNAPLYFPVSASPEAAAFPTFS